MNYSSFSSSFIRVFLFLFLAAGTAQGLKAQQSWYVGVQGGTSFGQGTMRSITEHQIHLGAQGGVYGGYRLNRLFSIELAVQSGAQSQYALDCCPYWLSESMERSFAPVNGKTGWYYRDLESHTQWGKLALQTNFDLISLFTASDSRWSLNLSPQIAAVTTSSRLITPDKDIQFDRQWHAGLGGQASVGLRITQTVGAALYGGISCLTGDRFDNIPEYAHKSNLIWDAGLKLSFSFGKSRTQKPAAVQSTATDTDDEEAARLAAERERAQRERQVAEAQAREREIAAALEREQAERQAAAAAAEKERVFNTPIPTVYFANNSSIIEKTYIPQLEEALAILERYPDFNLEIHAYSSQVGDKSYNELLSKGRMEEIRDWFINHGISAGRLGNAYYHGVDYNAPTQAAARRAELKFVK